MAFHAYQLAVCDKADVLQLCSYSTCLVSATFASILIVFQQSRLVSTTIVVFDTTISGLILAGNSILRDHSSSLHNYALAGLYFIPLLLGLFDASSFRVQSQDYNPVVEAPFLTRLTFGWLSPLFDVIGHRPVTESDLFHLGSAWHSEKLLTTFSEVSETQCPLRITLLLRQHWKYLVVATALQAVSSAATFYLPWLLRSLLRTQALPTFLTMFGFILLSTVTKNHAIYYYLVVGMRIKATVIACVYSKVLTIAPNSTNIGNVVNLVDVDSERIVAIMPLVHQYWTLPIQVIVCIGSLIYIMGPISILCILGVFGFTIPLLSFTSAKVRHIVSLRMSQTDERTSFISEMLVNIKSIKLSAYTLTFLARLQGIRSKEVDFLGRRAIYNSLGAATMIGSLGVMITGTLLSTYLTRGQLSSEIIFPSLMFFSLLSMPLSMLTMLVMETAAIKIAFRRINAFLMSPERTAYVKSSQPILNHKAGKGALAVAMKDVTLSVPSYSDESKGPILSGLNFEARSGQLVTISGQVGSGKTSLLLGLLEDLRLEQGEVFVNGRAAYVSQTAWLIDGTIRENIICGLPFNSEYYEQTLQACALLDDIRRLKLGDQTKVGHRGITLSGGQKSRVSIARAVYANAEVYMLDDPLAALDTGVEEHIVREVLGPNGILKEKTKILATNTLDAIRIADSVCLVANGTLKQAQDWKFIFEDGEAPEVKQYLTNLLAATAQAKAKESPTQNENSATPSAITDRPAVLESQRPDAEVTDAAAKAKADVIIVETETTDSLANSTDSSDLERSPEAGALATDPYSAGNAEGIIEAHVYQVWIRSMTIRGLFITLIPLIGFQTFGLATTYSLKILSDTPHSSLLILAFTASFSVLQGVSMYLFLITLYYQCILPAGREMHRRLAESVFRSRLFFFETTPLGNITTRFANDIARLDTSLPNTMANLLFMTPSILVAIGIVLFISPLTVALIFPVSYIYFRIQAYFLNLSRSLKRLENHTRGAVTSNLQETITGATIIRKSGLIDTFKQKNFANLDLNMSASIPCYSVDSWLGMRLDALGVVLQIVAAGLLLASKPSSGTLGFAMTYILQMPSLFGAFVKCRAVLEADMVSLERLLTFEKNEAEGSIQDGPVAAAVHPPDNWPLNGQVEFRNFSMKYSDGLPLCLTDIDICIPAGSRIGIVGRTGAGKSSLALGLLRACEAATGSIVIDEIDISTIPLETLRTKVAIIPQDSPVFRGTLRFNLDPLHRHSDAELCNVIRDTFPDNAFGHDITTAEILNLNLGDKAPILSSGQLQLLAIARAMLSNAKVIILDEGQSSFFFLPRHNRGAGAR